MKKAKGHIPEFVLGQGDEPEGLAFGRNKQLARGRRNDHVDFAIG